MYSQEGKMALESGLCASLRLSMIEREHFWLSSESFSLLCKLLWEELGVGSVAAASSFWIAQERVAFGTII